MLPKRHPHLHTCEAHSWKCDCSLKKLSSFWKRDLFYFNLQRKLEIIHIWVIKCIVELTCLQIYMQLNLLKWHIIDQLHVGNTCSLLHRTSSIQVRDSEHPCKLQNKKFVSVGCLLAVFAILVNYNGLITYFLARTGPDFMHPM